MRMSEPKKRARTIQGLKYEHSGQHANQSLHKPENLSLLGHAKVRILVKCLDSDAYGNAMLGAQYLGVFGGNIQGGSQDGLGGAQRPGGGGVLLRG